MDVLTFPECVSFKLESVSEMKYMPVFFILDI